MTAPVPVPDGTTPPAEAVEAAYTAFRDYVLRDDKDPSVDGGVFRAVAAAVVAALDLEWQGRTLYDGTDPQGVTHWKTERRLVSKWEPQP